MSAYLHPRGVELSETSGHALAPRAAFLKGWLIEGDNLLKYSHGLTGVDQAMNYVWVEVCLYAFLAVGLVTLVMHIAHMCHRQMRHMSTMGDRKQTYWKDNRSVWWPWIQRHVFVAPLRSKRHNRSFQLSSAIDNGTLPGRWHTLILVLYTAANIAWCALLPYHGPRHAAVAALRGRSGTLAALNLIPTILFALRNNPLISLLQVSYDDFNLFHRWAARITISEALIHTAAWLANTQEGGGWKAVAAGLRDEESYTYGTVGTVAFVFILIQAASPVRHAFYETFLNIHRLSIILALVGVWMHLERHGLPQLPWVNLVCILWGLEWCFRFIRIGYHNVKLNRVSKIKVEAMPGEACRVTIDLIRPWYVRPGCHVHLWTPALNGFYNPLSSHPFSVAWSAPMKLDSKEMALPTHEGQPMGPCAPRTSSQISLVCRARTGMTRKMYERAAASPSSSFTTWGFMEGPYGGHHSLDSYGTVVLMAGGVGITHQVLYCAHLVRGFANQTTSTQKILLVWAIPDSECLEWVRPWMDEILRMPSRKQCLRIKIFISRPKRRLNQSPSESVQMYSGRPNHRELIAEETRNRVGAMAVTVCAGGAFSDDVRAAVRPMISVGSVDFIEEAFTY